MGVEREWIEDHLPLLLLWDSIHNMNHEQRSSSATSPQLDYILCRVCSQMLANSYFSDALFFVRSVHRPPVRPSAGAGAGQPP